MEAGGVAVLTDSSACLPAWLARRCGVTVVPLQVIVDDAASPEDEGAPDRVARALRAGHRVTTSQPSPAALAQALETAAASGARHAVAVSISGEVSGTANAWELAGREAGLPVTVVDSRTLALALGFAAGAAGLLAAAGASADAVAKEAERVAGASACVFTVAGLDHLRKGGRITSTQSAVGGALGLRPVLAIQDGSVVPASSVRTTAKARDAVIERALAAASQYARPVAGVMTMPGDQQAAAHARIVLENAGVPVVVAPLSAALGAHGGPGTVAIAVADASVELEALVRAGS